MIDLSKLKPKHRQELRLLKSRGYPMAVKSPYHWKYREVNYYFTTGKITIDPNLKYKDSGIEALIALLKSRYPKAMEEFIIAFD